MWAQSTILPSFGSLVLPDKPNWQRVIVITPAYLGSSPGARHSWCTQEEVLLSIRSWSFSIWKPRRLSQGLQTVASLRFLSIKNRHTLHYLSHRPCLGLALDSLRSFGLRQICMDGIGEYQHHAGAQHPVIRFTAFSLGMMAPGVLLANRHLITERGRSFRGLQLATTFVPMRSGISRLPFAELLQVASSGIVTQKPRCKEAVSTTIIHHSSDWPSRFRAATSVARPLPPVSYTALAPSRRRGRSSRWLNKQCFQTLAFQVG